MVVWRVGDRRQDGLQREGEPVGAVEPELVVSAAESFLFLLDAHRRVEGRLLDVEPLVGVCPLHQHSALKFFLLFGFLELEITVFSATRAHLENNLPVGKRQGRIGIMCPVGSLCNTQPNNFFIILASFRHNEGNLKAH